LRSRNDRESDMLKQMQFGIARGAPIEVFDTLLIDEALGFEFSCYGRVYRVFVVEEG
jgi:hypothetical protein